MTSLLLGYGFGGFGNLANNNNLRSNTKFEPIPPLQQLKISYISTNLWHSIFITELGQCYVSGRGRYGALGLGEAQDMATNIVLPTLVPKFKINRVIHAAAGRKHSLFLTDDFRIWSCGFGIARGVPSTEISNTPTPIGSLLQHKVTDCCAGNQISACINSEGTAFFWGLDTKHPVSIKSIPSPVQKCVAGDDHILFLSTTGQVYQYIAKSQSSMLIKFPNLNQEEQIIQIAAGCQMSVALTNLNRLFIWKSISLFQNPSQRDPYFDSLPLHTPQLVPFEHKIQSIHCTSTLCVVLTAQGQVFWMGKKEDFTQQVTTQWKRDFQPFHELMSLKIDRVCSGGHNVFAQSGVFGNTEWKTLLEKQWCTDFQIVVSKDKTIPVHKCILANKCKLFKKLFSTDTSLTQWQWNTKDYSLEQQWEVMQLVMEFIYSNGIRNNNAPIAKEIMPCVKQLLQDLQPLYAIQITPHSISAKQEDFTSNLSQLLQTPSHSDLELIIKHDDDTQEQQSFSCHKCVLCTKSEYFSAMFINTLLQWSESSSKQLEIEVEKDIPFQAMQYVLEYLYTDQLPSKEVLSEYALFMFHLSNRFHLQKCNFLLEQFILSNVDTKNGLALLQYCAANFYFGSAALQRQLQLFVAKHLDRVKIWKETIDEQWGEEMQELKDEIYKLKGMLQHFDEVQLQNELEEEKFHQMEKEFQENQNRVHLAQENSKQDHSMITHILSRYHHDEEEEENFDEEEEEEERRTE